MSHTLRIGDTWFLLFDPELRIVHTDSQCPDARVPQKYKYMEQIRIERPEDARQLDQKGARPCLRCHKVEWRKVVKGRYTAPPGFRLPPKGTGGAA